MRLTSLVRRHYSLDGEAVARLDPEFYENLIAALKEMPKHHRDQLRIGKAYRSTEEQTRLYEMYQRGEAGLTAKPGTSLHEKGMAVDFYPQSGGHMDLANYRYRRALAWLFKHGPKHGVYGLTDHWGNHNARDIVHFEMGPFEREEPKPKRRWWWQWWN